MLHTVGPGRAVVARGAHSLFSSSTSSFFWQPVSLHAMLNCTHSGVSGGAVAQRAQRRSVAGDRSHLHGELRPGCARRNLQPQQMTERGRFRRAVAAYGAAVGARVLTHSPCRRGTRAPHSSKLAALKTRCEHLVLLMAHWPQVAAAGPTSLAACSAEPPRRTGVGILHPMQKWSHLHSLSHNTLPLIKHPLLAQQSKRQRPAGGSGT